MVHCKAMPKFVFYFLFFLAYFTCLPIWHALLLIVGAICMQDPLLKPLIYKIIVSKSIQYVDITHISHARV